MTNLFRSKFGVVLVGIYSLVVLFATFEYVRTPPEAMKNFALMILTLPGSFATSFLLDILNLQSREGDKLLWLWVGFGWIFNAVILYSIGVFIEKLVRYFSDNVSKN